MSKISRRSLARYAADQLLAGKSAKLVAEALAAAVIENGQAGNTDYLLSDINAELENRRALTVGNVSSARPLTDDLRQQLSAQLKKATGAEAVLLNESVEPELIGGLRVETAGQVWDTSLRRKLQQLKEVR
jgi:ATP synthase F1 delta subunit